MENIEPRKRLLEVWSAVGGFTMVDRKWRWHGRTEPNSISDAEQLLCILLPATALPQLRLAHPDETSEDATLALRPLGSESQIPRTIIEALEDYLSRYTDDGTPTFAGGSAYLPCASGEMLTAQQRDLDLLASFTTSVSLCLTALEFLQDYIHRTARGAWLARAAELRKRVDSRLTAALAGLIRGFAVNLIEPDSAEGATLLHLLDQGETGDARLIVNEFDRSLEPVRVRLSEPILGIEPDLAIMDPGMLFEVGWTWGIARGAPKVELGGEAESSALPSRDGVALPAPSLYFTMLALDAIELLTRDRTRMLGLLNPTQDRLAAALSLRRDLTHTYWSRLARFGRGRWPLEDLPWRTPDGAENDYYSLMVSAVLVRDLQQRTATEADLQRLVPLLSELASRARITRRPLRGDPMLGLHEPGLRIELAGAEEFGSTMGYQLSDFAAVLLKRCAQLAQLTVNPSSRDRLLTLATEVWNHLSRRRIEGGRAAGLWDDPARVFADLDGERREDPLWSMNARVVDALVCSVSALGARQARSSLLSDTAAAMVDEAEFLLDQQRLSAPSLYSPLQHSPLQRGLEEIRWSLQRARTLIESQPSTAIGLCVTAVNQLDKYTLAREDASGGWEQ